ncbi:MAG: winged helix-turn-helix transcriptional regulator [Flexilinea sp.]|nr:winged helix-turn-helix transcriptional regulator [Flexilinea sp.]
MFIKESRKPIRRNPLITRTLYYSKDMESFATGLKRIQNFCNDAGVKVEFYGDRYGFTVRFYRHCGEGWAELAGSDEIQNEPQTMNGPQNGPQSENGTQNVTQNVTQNDSQSRHFPKYQSDTLNVTLDDTLENKILILLHDNPLEGQKSIAEKLQVSVLTIKRVMKKMKEKGIIIRHNGKRYGYWEITEPKE